MPTKRRRIARFQHDWMTETHAAWLLAEPFDPERHDWFIYRDLDRDDAQIEQLDTLDPPRCTPYLESAVTGRRLWGLYGAEVTDAHISESPGTRPGRWWQFDAPEPRRRLGGIGTPCHERLAHVESYFLGVPSPWIRDHHIETYERLETPLNVPALDLADPPTFESEAAFLDRHGLLSAGERRQLSADDFEPESVLDIFEFDSAETLASR